MKRVRDTGDIDYKEMKKNMRMIPAFGVNDSKPRKNLKFVVLIFAVLIEGCTRGLDTTPSPSPSSKSNFEKPQSGSKLSNFELAEILAGDKCVREVVLSEKENWSSRMVGADLAKDFLKKKVPNLQRINVGIIDVGFQSRIKSFGLEPDKYFDDPQFISAEDANKGNQDVAIHGTFVADLIFDRHLGFSLFGNLRELGFIDFWKNHQDANVKIINRSGGFLPGDSEPLKQYIESGGIYVQGAGNDYGMTSPYFIDGSEFSARSNISHIINVGAIGIDGLVSDFSDEFEDVTILAPGTNISVRDNRGVYGHSVSGTSFSTPIVTGALINVLALQPQLNIHEIKQMLKETSFRSLIQSLSSSGLNGTGVLNAYALARIAESPLLERTSEALRLEEEAKSVSRKASCSELLRAFNHLREAFFINPTQARASLLADLYSRFGLMKEAEFMSSLELGYDEGFNQLKQRFEYLVSGSVSLESKAYQNQLSLLTFVSRFSEDSQIYTYFLGRIKEMMGGGHGITPESVAKLEGRALFYLQDFYLKGSEETRGMVMYQIGTMIHSRGNLTPLYAPKIKNAKVLIKIIGDLINHPSVDKADKKWLRKWCANFDATFKETYLNRTGRCMAH